MASHLSPSICILILLAAGGARAEEGARPAEIGAAASNPWGARGRLEVKAAFGVYDHTVTAGGERSTGSGSALSHVGASGAWLAERMPLGVGAALDLEGFALRSQTDPAARAVPVTGLDASAGLLARLGGPGARLALEGQLGYAFARVPVFEPSSDAPAMGVAAGALQGHGPAVGARVTVALAASVDLEASARVLPVLFGAQAHGDALSLRRYAAGGAARVGLFDAGAMRISALAGYEADVVDGSGGTLAVHQLQHRIGLGLRASFSEVRPPAALPPVASAVIEPKAAPAGPTIRGVVRTDRQPEGLVPLPEVTVTAPDGRTVATDAEGRFALDALAPGLAQLRFSSPGYLDKTEVVALAAQGEVVLEIALQSATAPRTAALIGQVRMEDGAPVEAQVRIRELGLSARADQQGRFRFDVPPGRYTLTIESPGFVSQRKAAPMGAGQQSIFNIDLKRLR